MLVSRRPLLHNTAFEFCFECLVMLQGPTNSADEAEASFLDAVDALVSLAESTAPKSHGGPAQSELGARAYPFWSRFGLISARYVSLVVRLC